MFGDNFEWEVEEFTDFGVLGVGWKSKQSFDDFGLTPHVNKLGSGLGMEGNFRNRWDFASALGEWEGFVLIWRVAADSILDKAELQWRVPPDSIKD